VKYRLRNTSENSVEKENLVSVGSGFLNPTHAIVDSSAIYNKIVNFVITVKPAHVVTTSIKQSPVSKGHIFIVLS
jgi:hypothetical protein